jgi:hypothetical protein
MPKEDLVWEVENRCVESPENTAHSSNGSDALQTIIEAYDSDIIEEEEEFTRFTFMLISVYKGASADKPLLVEDGVSNIFKDEERLYDLLADMVDDEGWELLPRLGGPKRDPGPSRRTRGCTKYVQKRAIVMPLAILCAAPAMRGMRIQRPHV